mgnify:CR=1 FL=1
MEILRKLTTEENIPKKYYHAVFGAEVAGMPCIVSKTGYTGEDGVEIYLASDLAEKMWETLLEAGKEEGLILVDLVLVIHFVWKQQCLFTDMRWMMKYHLLKQV